MTEISDRVLRCFASVFPFLTAEEIRTAGVGRLEAWDSLTAVTLVAVLQEEFKIEINPEDMPELITFAAVEEYLKKHVVYHRESHIAVEEVNGERKEGRIN